MTPPPRAPGPAHTYVEGFDAFEEAMSRARWLAPMRGGNEWIHRHRHGSTCNRFCRVVHPDGAETKVLA